MSTQDSLRQQYGALRIFPPADTTLHAAPFPDLTPAQLYAILRLRVDVFVVEQACSFAELDGRDEEPGAVHLWHEQDAVTLSTARLLREESGGVPTGRIGRVATAPAARGRGLAGELMTHGLRHFEGLPVVLGAQAHLEAYYGRFGFVRSGDPYDEDGIPHVPMRREAG